MEGWKVLYTKSRCEKKAATELENLGFVVYCPLIETVRQWSDRKKKVKSPLFNSYVFVKTDEASHEEVFRSPYVVRYLFWLGKPAIVRDVEINAIRDFLSEIEPIENAIIDFEYLQEVKIMGGIMKGNTGKFLFRKKNKLVLQIESLGMVLKTELHHSLVV
jgi:transcription antitermination factor NusG